MAIQHRRGNYADFDPTKMVAGEPAVVLGGDPTSSDGKAAYIAFGPGSVKKLATAEDMRDEIYNQTQNIIQEVEEGVADDVERAESAAESVTQSATRIAQNTQDINDIKADLSELEEAVDSFEGISDEVKEALLTCFRHVPFLDDDADYYNALRTALYASTEVISISAVFNPGTAVIYPNATLDDLKEYLTVTATYADSHTSEVTSYTLSGTIAIGVCTITVSYKGNTTTFNVTVSDYEWGSDYTWLYRADRDGLLSQNANVSVVTGINGTLGVESIKDSVLNVSATYTGSSCGNIYKLIPLTNTNAVLKAKVRFNKLPKSNSPSGLRLQVSNGTSGAQLFAYCNATENTYRIATHEGGTQRLLVDNIDLNKWYVLECELQGTKQVLKVDNSTFTFAQLSNYANTETRVIVQEPEALAGVDVGDVDVDIAWISFKDKSN